MNNIRFLHMHGMKQFFPISLLLIIGTFGQLQAQITSVGCDSMALVVNVGSQETALNLYHPGGYLTWPPSENVMEWLFTDEEGNVVHEETLIDNNFVSFGHNVPITDTLFVSVLLTNDSSIYYDGNPVACLIEDYLTWEEEEIIPGTVMGSWTLGGAVGTYAGEPSNIGDAPGGVIVSIYPNPVSNELRISGTSGPWRISNSLGQIQSRGIQIQGDDIVLDTSAWSEGLYIFQSQQKAAFIVQH